MKFNFQGPSTVILFMKQIIKEVSNTILAARAFYGKKGINDHIIFHGKVFVWTNYNRGNMVTTFRPQVTFIKDNVRKTMLL